MEIKKHNFIFIVMLFLLGTTSVLMGGCQKDYDGQLEIIRNQIKDGEISLDNLNSKVILIDEQIAALQKALEDAETTEEHKKDIQAVLKKLDDVKTELEGKIAGLEKKIADNNEELIGIKDSIESLEQQFNEKLLAISIEIQGIDVRLDALDGRVNALEGQVKALEEIRETIQDEIDDLRDKIAKAPSQELIGKLEKAVGDLTKLQEELGNSITTLTKQVGDIATDVKRHEEAISDAARDIIDINNRITEVMAEHATEFKNLWDAINGIKEQYTKWDEKFEKLTDEFSVLQNDYIEKIAALEELIKTVEPEKIAKEIEEVKKELNELSGAVEKNKTDILTTSKLVADVKKQVEALNKIVTEYEQRILAIEKEIESIQEDIKNLFDRIQSMVIIPQYIGNYVKLESSDNGYELTMEVDIRPFEVAKKIAEGAFSISVKSVDSTPTRAENELPVFSIESITSTQSSTFTITASTTMEIENASIYSTPMNFQVALALNDVSVGASKNDRLSEYMGVYYVAPGSVDEGALYKFYEKNGDTKKELENVKESISPTISESDCYQRYFLIDGNFMNQSHPIFDSKITANRGEPQTLANEGEDLEVEFSLASAAYSNQTSLGLANCFTVSSNGIITQIKDASAYVKSLDGVKIFVGLQAKKGSVKYGKHCYICVVLKNNQN
ncbi:hypothetical protein [Bacteroides congonensis]